MGRITAKGTSSTGNAHPSHPPHPVETLFLWRPP
jgi:hypothetical protein